MRLSDAYDIVIPNNKIIYELEENILASYGKLTKGKQIKSITSLFNCETMNASPNLNKK